ncbi:cytoplasmic dynein 1 intermediate chain 2-like isoform X7 [Mizuhopecten yessoensis]|uniref:cytoplasmic dynein 1 intermediate chain 2-like isoform X7 n=1 Tax=Mizuhopecten yessoensis TaxID=6573 RepID=UPI000B45C9A4|nr:cytoplasmic dynein 1 intermediate chain 2-like isoform X7 [Mizuhopecten yessoensis]
MSDRKAELERKKAKLEQMRKERQEKDRIKKLKEVPDENVQKKAPTGDIHKETEDLLRDLGIPPAGATPATVPSEAAKTNSGQKDQESTPPQPPQTLSMRPKMRLSVAKVSETSIPPRENVMYNKETQTTIVEPLDKEDDISDAGSSPKRGQGPGSRVLVYDDPVGRTDDDADSVDVPEHSPSHKMPHVEMVPPSKTLEDEKKEEKPLPELSEEEKKQAIMSEDFQTFFDHTSRLIERALCESVDIFTDYTGGDGEGKDDDLAGERLKLNREFYDERWSKHRTITSLDWSKQHPELLVASYNTNEDAPHDPDGVALVWNIKFKKQTPEYVFHCQSAVMSSCFAEFHPNLVVGGTYSGQIVLWDNRVNKRTPVQRTPLSAAAHTHPVYCVNVVGTQNAHNLISVSTDGKMCSWSLDMLSQPQDSMELQHKQSKAVAVTSFSFLANDVNNFVVGSEDCTVYTACRHGSKAGISEAFEGHQGPITGINCHSVPGQIDFSPYFLTSSFDWTIKLWSIKDSKFIHSFEDNSDYVYDVQWSPVHPALFASVDGMGRLDLWHLNNDTEVPTASVVMENNVALNRCRWHQTGAHIATGDDLGHIYIYDVAETIATPKHDEWSRFAHSLHELKQHAAEREEESSLATMTSPLR